MEKKTAKKNFLNFFSKFGPGLITGASDDDPSGILTYLQAGAILGLKSLWMTLFTLPLMYGIQEMCGRIGLVTKKGLLTLIKENFSKLILYPIALISLVVITINLGADLLAISVVLEKLFDVGRIFWLIGTAVIILFFTIFLSYKKFARVLKWLTLSLFFYVVAVFYMHLDFGKSLAATFLPSFSWGKESLLILAAIFGTTVSPYLFFWQTSEEVEEREEKTRHKFLKRFLVTKHDLKDLKEDTFLGMLFSNVVMWFIIAGASQLGSLYGLKAITNFDDASLVLKSLLGNWAYLSFSLGIIGTGLLAIPVLGGCVGYILAEIFNWQEGMNKTFLQAKGFYLAIGGATVVGIFLSIFNLDPVKLLIYTAVFYTLATPLLVLLILRLGNDKKVMKHNTNSAWSNFLGIATFLISSIIVLLYLSTLI